MANARSTETSGRRPIRRSSQQKTAAKASKAEPLSTAYSLRSFVGHLEGTLKASHTIDSYRSDLVTFQEFLESGLGSKPVRLEQLTSQDLRQYSEYLVKRGLKTNTRRRKLLTVRRFLRYLTKRKKLRVDPGEQLPAPYKVERVPFTVELPRLLSAIRSLPVDSVLQRRNRVLLWTLVETGCLVSEAAKLQYEQWVSTPEGGLLQIEGKSRRVVKVSSDLYEAVQGLRKVGEGRSPGSGRSWIFFGFNKFGSLGAAISPRGIELLVRHFAPLLGSPELTPRTIRHSAVIQWHREGMKIAEIQQRLGLKTAYAFRSYRPLFREEKPGA